MQSNSAETNNTSLIAGVGLEDTTSISGHWNSLDEAAKALKTLPENPTEQQLNQWGNDWALSLVRHFREGGIIPPLPGHLSEMVLITKVGNEPYYRRTTIAWDGYTFRWWFAGQDLEKQRPYVKYSGSCREFVVHSSDEGGSLIPAKYRNFWEQQRMSEIGNRMKEATTVTELATGVAGLEEMLTQIDTRIEGDHAGIAPPYATAEWDEDHNGWTTHFNAKCDPSATPVNAPSVSVNSNPAPATAVAGTPQKKKRNFFQKIFQENDDTSVAMEPSTAPK